MPKRVTPTLITSNVPPSSSSTIMGTAGQQTEARLLREAPHIAAALKKIERKEGKKKKKDNPIPFVTDRKKRRLSASHLEKKPKKPRKPKHPEKLRCCLECELYKRGQQQLSRKKKKELIQMLASLKQ
jgi:hypothetical protein